ncbi:hypothetical protein N7449_008202 [Penicillium cf. viridicatum]|uniref:Uncharacterized protein n=1 Tax=Penicillium cf. viridicatum TaxID=2972119 RepID=A0A9W9JBU7_9EURO|nr:hypothetical protein N7449_008202 [Penicillium cf. viridicatum]
MAKLGSVTAHTLIPLAVLFAKSALAAHNSLWQPAQNDESVGYSRVIQLQHAGGANGKLLATFEHWYTDTDNTPSYYIIRESTNNSTTWDTLTTAAASGDLPNSALRDQRRCHRDEFIRRSGSPGTPAIDINSGDLALYRVGDKEATTLSSKPVPGGIKANQKYHLSLSVKSTTIVATVTGSGGAKTSFSIIDDGLGRGMAGLFGSYGSGGFSNVQIKSVTSTMGLGM